VRGLELEFVEQDTKRDSLLYNNSLQRHHQDPTRMGFVPSGYHCRPWVKMHSTDTTKVKGAENMRMETKD
jgi:hypothetical protein